MPAKKPFRMYVLVFKATEVPDNTTTLLKSLDAFELPGGTWLVPFVGALSELIGQLNHSFGDSENDSFFLATLSDAFGSYNKNVNSELDDWLRRLQREHPYG